LRKRLQELSGHHWKTGGGDWIRQKAAFHLIDKDRREYQVVAKDGYGKVYLDVQGKVTRRKVAEKK
jgi:hypothetical protein